MSAGAPAVGAPQRLHPHAEAAQGGPRREGPRLGTGNARPLIGPQEACSPSFRPGRELPRPVGGEGPSEPPPTPGPSAGPHPVLRAGPSLSVQIWGPAPEPPPFSCRSCPRYLLCRGPPSPSRRARPHAPRHRLPRPRPPPTETRRLRAGEPPQELLPRSSRALSPSRGSPRPPRAPLRPPVPRPTGPRPPSPEAGQTNLSRTKQKTLIQQNTASLGQSRSSAEAPAGLQRPGHRGCPTPPPWESPFSSRHFPTCTGPPRSTRSRVQIHTQPRERAAG